MSRDFGVWQRSVWDLTSYAVLASLIGTGLLYITIALAQSALTGSVGSARVGPFTMDLPDATALVLVLAAILLTVSSVVQSWLRKVDAVLVRHRLRRVSASADEPLPTRTLMSERFLMEGWTQWVTSVVQALGFSFLLVWAGGLSAVVGVLGAAGLATLVGRHFFKRAKEASEAFLDAQREATRLQRVAANDSEAGLGVPAALTRVTDAVYRRDNEAFRLPAGWMAVLSLGLIAAAIIPAVVAVQAAALPLYLIVLLMWRQRAIDAVTTLGVLAWTLTVWRTAPTTVALDETGLADLE